MELNILHVMLLLDINNILGEMWTVDINVDGEPYSGSGGNLYMDVIGTIEVRKSLEVGKDFLEYERRQILLNADFGQVKRIRIYTSDTDGLRIKNIAMTSGPRHYNFVCNCWLDSDEPGEDSKPSWTLYAAVGTKSLWRHCYDRKGIVYEGDIKFQMSVNQTWECAKECRKYGTSCLAFSIVQRSMTCYGYGELHNAMEVYRAELWKQLCTLPGYAYVHKWNKCVKIYTENLLWDDASAACSAHGGCLLRFDRWEVFSILVSDGPYWIGGRSSSDGSSSDWIWENGVAVNQSYWALNQPSNSSNTCLALSDLHEGLKDEDCSAQHGYMCQEQMC